MYSRVIIGFFLASILFAACKPKTASDNATSSTSSAQSTASDPSNQKRVVYGFTSERLKWNLDTSVGDYNKKGQHDSKWDVPAVKALDTYAHFISQPTDTFPGAEKIIADNAGEAIAAGCTDPLVKYLFIRFDAGQAGKQPPDVAKGYADVWFAIKSTSYDPARKMYVLLRTFDAANQVRRVDPQNKLVEGLWMELEGAMRDAMGDTTMPKEECYQLCNYFFTSAFRYFPNQDKWFDSFYTTLERNWSKTDIPELTKGAFYIDFAWAARGNGYANTVTDSNWKLMQERLKIAEKLLLKAADKDPRDPYPYVELIRVELGQGNGREVMEKWFNQAMERDSDNLRACTEKLYYLEPKWYGSTEEMLKFGRECAQSKVWGGRVPLVLIDAHNSASSYATNRTNYWQNPAIYEDIKMSYDAFLKRYPNSRFYEQWYLKYAVQFEHWEDAKAQLDALGGELDVSFYGSEAEVDKIKLAVAAHSK